MKEKTIINETARSKVYELMFKGAIKSLGGDVKKVKVVRGSTFQLKPNYFTFFKDIVR